MSTLAIPPFPRRIGRGIAWPLMERAPQGPYSSAHEALQVDSHCVPCGLLARLWDSCAALPGHPALWPAGCSMWGPMAFPMGSWGARCGPPGRPLRAYFLNSKTKTDLVNQKNDLVNHETRFSKPGQKFRKPETLV